MLEIRNDSTLAFQMEIEEMLSILRNAIWNGNIDEAEHALDELSTSVARLAIAEGAK